MIRRIRFVLLAASLVLAIPSFADEHCNSKVVLITGASSGIGRNLAETLASKGIAVYAGARKDTDLDELEAIDNITAVRVDVTQQDDIDAAVDVVAAAGCGLYGLVNNAGVAVSGPFASLSDDDLDFQFGVNVDGVVRVTRSFLPLIIVSEGRIVTTGSISGILSGATLNAYSMSKHAVEAFTDSLAAELATLNVSVSVVEPGNYKSKIRRSLASRQIEKAKMAGEEITDEMESFAASMSDRELSFEEPDDVSAAFEHALFDENPLRRYMVVPDEGEAELTIRKVIEEMVQLNAWGPYSYSRDELVELLDEELMPERASN